MNDASPPQISTLKNGLRVVTYAMPGLHSASIGVWVNAGGRDERAAQNGIAHFLEHMAFKGTTTRSALDIAEIIEDVGGYINAYTSRDMTAYYARVLTQDTGLALDVIGDILRNPVFDPREIEVERGVILQEIGQAQDTPDDVVFDWLQEVAYPDQPMGRSILGPAGHVANFQRDDLTGFVTEHYGPGQLIVAAAGGIDHATILAQAEAIFGDMAPQTQPPRQPAKWASGEMRREKLLEQAHFTLALEGPAYDAPDFYAAQLWTSALGGGMSSRLFQKLREEHGLCYSIFAQSIFQSDTGMMLIYAGTSGAQLRKLAELTMDEIRRSADGLRTPEIDRAKAQARAGILMALESPSAQAERLARSLAIWGRIPEPEETAERIMAVTADEIRDHAIRMIENAAPAMALYGPIADAPDHATLTRRLVA